MVLRLLMEEQLTKEQLRCMVVILAGCVYGGFNDLLSSLEKRGGLYYPQWLLDGFRHALVDCQLVGMGLNGCGFTWERRRGTDRFTQERLDRVVCNGSWRSCFPSALLSHLSVVT
uniref:Uncharacterized protein n=1 Tax=Manihot esculenta TaxID=3983 RepID=A0A2C9W5D3_MANES